MNQLNLLFCLFIAGAHAAPAATASAGTPAKNENLEELRGQIQNLQQKLAETESDRDDVNDALKRSERAISNANRTLEELLTRQRQLSRSARDLASSIATKQREVQTRQAQVARLFRQRYQTGSPAAWQLWLNAQNPNDLARQRRYAEYWAQAQQETLQKLREETRQLEQLLGSARNQEQELGKVAEEQQLQQRILLDEKKIREQTLTKLSNQIKDQKQQLTKLQRDEKRLTELVARLAELARIRAEKKAKQEQLAKAAREKKKNKQPLKTAKAPGKKQTAPAITLERAEPAANNGTRFAALRGRMRLPVSGNLIGRYGQTRPEGGAWKGAFIQVPPGHGVNTVANGEVVFADWLRGFGNLIIIDHGEGYMSLYGYNETLLKQVGDSVSAGDRIAISGASGGQSEPGVYFEIRFQGRPVDPLTWAS